MIDLIPTTELQFDLIPTTELQFVRRTEQGNGTQYERTILQQKWILPEVGSNVHEWRDVPLRTESGDQPAQTGTSQAESGTDAGPNGTEAAVCAEIAKSQKLGLQKYGMSVRDNPLKLKAWLQHALEESLDKSIYLKRAIEEIEKTEQAGIGNG